MLVWGRAKKKTLTALLFPRTFGLQANCQIKAILNLYLSTCSLYGSVPFLLVVSNVFLFGGGVWKGRGGGKKKGRALSLFYLLIEGGHSCHVRNNKVFAQ